MFMRTCVYVPTENLTVGLQWLTNIELDYFIHKRNVRDLRFFF